MVLEEVVEGTPLDIIFLPSIETISKLTLPPFQAISQTLF